MRFAAAFAVFGFHVHVLGIVDPASPAGRIVSAIFAPGAIGVSFFFVLSGFVLTWSARPGDTAPRIWRRRAARILPNHVVTWAIALVGVGLLGSSATPAWVALVNLVLGQAWVPDEQVYFSLNTPAWSLSCEAFFYAMFPFLIRWVDRVPTRFLWGVAGSLVVLVMLAPLVGFALNPATAYWFAYVFPATRLIEFALGIVLARLVMSGKWIGVGLWPATALFAACYLLSSLLPSAFGAAAATIVPLALLIPAAAVSDAEDRPSPWRHHVLVWLGEISFAFYLVHQLVIRVFSKLVGPGPWAPPVAVGGTVGMLLVALACAAALHRFVEVPANSALTRRRESTEPATDRIPETDRTMATDRMPVAGSVAPDPVVLRIPDRQGTATVGPRRGRHRKPGHVQRLRVASGLGRSASSRS